ncbi:TraB/GumN family protein [Tsuneonella mangrovi]|uniref:TraB/GumN family protein n=1 Tax=Tsuneonella mangrovi TaxID=1982042 RepID=UPI000BA1F005|nr:TraB/GumN family protein [Tsuneonella mangrovi]
MVVSRSLRRAATATIASVSLLLSGLPAFAEQAQPDASVATAVTAATPSLPPGPALWEVRDEDTTIFLFGTVHALPKGVDWLRGKIAPALQSSDTLVTEIAMTPDDTAKVKDIVMAKGVLPEGQSLRGLLSDEQRTKYDAAMTDLGLPVAAFDRFEPWYATLLFTMIPLAKQGIASANGVEKKLQAEAGPDKARGALETVDYQLSLFDTLPQATQIDFLMKTIDGQDDIKAQLDAMIADWLAGDADGLAKLMNEDIDEPQLLDQLLYQRNRNWASWIKQRLDKPGTVFLAVGAGHLAGKGSVQDDLAAMGIKVERVQ